MRQPTAPETLLGMYAVVDLIRDCLPQIEAGKADASYLRANLEFLDQFLLHDLCENRCSVNQENAEYMSIYETSKPIDEICSILELEKLKNSEQLVDLICKDPHRIQSSFESALGEYTEAFLRETIDWDDLNVLLWTEQKKHVLGIVKDMITLYGTPVWVSGKGFRSIRGGDVLGIKIMESLLALDHEGAITLGAVRRYPDVTGAGSGGDIELQVVNIGSTQEALQEDGVGTRSDEFIRYRDVDTDLQRKLIWSRDKGGQESHKFYGESAPFLLWNRLLKNLRDENPLQEEELVTMFRERGVHVTKLDKHLENLIQKLKMVTGKTHKHILTKWFDRGEGTIRLAPVN
tara:strand:- start:17800 stop:18840 length:1041 start_codon:yes stop_codon:yes gene_type:complete